MLINSASLNGLRTTFSTLFQARLEKAPSQYSRVATTVPSASRSNTYAGMKMLSAMRQWIGPRHIENLSEFKYELTNLPFEKTIGVDRDDISDDNLGQYKIAVELLADTVSAHPNIQVFNALKNGFTTLGYDGQYFFDTDHPLIGADGETVGTFANTDGGNGTPWFLMSSRSVMLPIIWQERKKPDFVAMDNPNDERVFTNKEFRYGVDSRNNVGYGFPQLCWGSKQTLNKANYETARAAISNMKGDGGRPLGLEPDLLVFPPSLEGAALELLNSERDAGGATNVWRNTAEPLKVSWLS